MEKYKTLARLAADILMILLVALAPVWAVFLFSIAFAWIFAPYYEIMLWGLAFDALYGFHSVTAIIIAAAAFIAIELFKRRTRI